MDATNIQSDKYSKHLSSDSPLSHNTAVLQQPATALLSWAKRLTFKTMTDSFGARSTLKVGSRSFEIFRLDAPTRSRVDTTRLPYSLRILLEDLLRTEDGVTVTRND